MKKLTLKKVLVLIFLEEIVDILLRSLIVKIPLKKENIILYSEFFTTPSYPKSFPRKRLRLEKWSDIFFCSSTMLHLPSLIPHISLFRWTHAATQPTAGEA